MLPSSNKASFLQLSEGKQVKPFYFNIFVVYMYSYCLFVRQGVAGKIPQWPDACTLISQAHY
jgi:hypothetical protein